ncbi:plasma serine protease inhibitor-like [Anomaloglossus baeobatrachus]|uniref:plasma serine protease inhibitor-like n=1 Tax=Anomaloglossus baeobatrachus TaxID=238106 RepID=UPI003F502623
MRVFLFLGAALLFPLVLAADDSTTRGKISELLHRVDQDLIIDLINYIYFKAKLENPSDKIRTEEGDFHVNEKTIVKVPFMIIKGMYEVALTDDATMVSIPYKGLAKALFILPNEGKESKMEQTLNEETIQKWKKSMAMRDVELHLPIFNVPSIINNKRALRKRDIVDADLSGITGEANVKISNVVDSSKLTAINRMLRFDFNRPFVSIITQGNTILGSLKW